MITTNNKPISAGTRLAAMILDHLFMTLIAVIFFLPGIILNISKTMSVSHEPADFNFMSGPMMYISFFGFALYFCKDVINGRSIAKRILKLQVVDNKTGQVASPLQCLIRNITCILWPVEVIVALINTSRRLGDRVAGTKLVAYDQSLQQPKLKFGKLLIPLIISYGIIVLVAQLTPSLPMSKPSYSESSYNQALSKEIEQIITENLGQYMIPDVRVYDSTKNENLKYLSAILRLKENYIDDDDSYRRLHETTTNLIYSRLPKESFRGQIKYVYRATGQFQARATSIGTNK